MVNFDGFGAVILVQLVLLHVFLDLWFIEATSFLVIIFTMVAFGVLI